MCSSIAGADIGNRWTQSGFFFPGRHSNQGKDNDQNGFSVETEHTKKMAPLKKKQNFSWFDGRLYLEQRRVREDVDEYFLRTLFSVRK